MVPDCTNKWSSLFSAREVNSILRDAVFGMGLPSSYEEWEAYPHILAVCSVHIRKLRTKDGRTIGYRYVNGKIRGYVKEEHF